MDEYISRKAAIAYIREQSEECQKAFEELGGESGIYADAYNDLAEDFTAFPPLTLRRWCMDGGFTMGAGLRVALIGAIVASVGNQITFARAQTTATTAGQRWTEVRSSVLLDIHPRCTNGGPRIYRRCSILLLLDKETGY